MFAEETRVGLPKDAPQAMTGLAGVFSRLRACALAAALIVPTAAFADTAPDLEDALEIQLPGLSFVEEISETAKQDPAQSLPPGEFSMLVYGDLPNMQIRFPETGLSGLVSLEQVEQAPLMANMRPNSGMVGDATLNWRLTNSLQINTTVGRRLSDTPDLSALGVFEDTVSGGFTYYLSPRFQMSAEGTLAAPDLVQQSLADLPSDTEASVAAIYNFLPLFSGRLNYTYDTQNSLLVEGRSYGPKAPESTVSFTLIGKF